MTVEILSFKLDKHKDKLQEIFKRYTQVKPEQEETQGNQNTIKIS